MHLQRMTMTTYLCYRVPENGLEKLNIFLEKLDERVTE